MNTEKLPNRWSIAVAAVCMQICLGAVYGWSVFKKPLMSGGHWSETSVQFNFTLAILVLGIGTIIGGLWLDKVGPRKVATTAGLIYGLGYLVSGFAASHHSLNGLYAGYGIIGGLGMGMGYICPVATLVKWFPDRRGLMTGIAVCGYGFGAAVMSPIAAWEIIHYSVAATFWTLGSSTWWSLSLRRSFTRTRRRAGVRRAGSRGRRWRNRPAQLISRWAKLLAPGSFTCSFCYSS